MRAWITIAGFFVVVSLASCASKPKKQAAEVNAANSKQVRPEQRQVSQESHVPKVVSAKINPSEFRSVVGFVYPGVKLYDRSYSYVGQILTVDPTRGARTVVLRYATGEVEVKSWDALLKWGWYVHRDDPAIN